MNLKKDIYDPVSARIHQRIDSLRNIKRFPQTGIEAWFKVEIVAALGGRVAKLQNKGPDLLFDDGTMVELKAATDFHKGFFIDPLKKYDYSCSCLFLADGKNPEILTSNISEKMEIVAYEIISDGENDWLLGLVNPRV